MGLTRKVNKELEGLIGQDPSYVSNPLASQQFGFAQNLFNSRMFGAPQLERNIFTSGANFNSFLGRNATDGSQALALGAAGLGETDNQLQELQLKEQQNKYGLLQNLNNAYGTMIGEGDKVFNDNVRRYGDKVQIKGAQAANKFAKQKSILNFATAGLNFLSGGGAEVIGKLFGNNKDSQS